jgi:hypothetical protein
MDPDLSFLAELNTAILHELIIPTMDPSFGPGKSPEREVLRLFMVTYSPETVHSPNLPTVPISRICCGQGWGTCHSLTCREEDNRYSYFDAIGNILYDSSASIPLIISGAASSRMLGFLQGRQRTVVESVGTTFFSLHRPLYFWAQRTTSHWPKTSSVVYREGQPVII